MRHVDVSWIRLNHIKIFLAVAEYGSFTVAAEKLHMTQPYISKIIAQLEQELDLYLIVRGSRKNQITPAAKSLYKDWKMMMQNFENSLISAHCIQTGMNDKLQIGIGQLTYEENPLIQNLKETKKRMRGLDIIVEYNDMSGLLDSLLHDMTDLIIISKHMLPSVEKLELDWKVILKTNLAVYLPESNPLCQRERLVFSDLKHESFIVFYYENDNSYMQLLQQLGQEAGFIPKISCYVSNENSFRANLELENGIVLADSFTALEGNGIKRYDLDISNDIIAVWKPKNEREGIQMFLSMFEQSLPE